MKTYKKRMIKEYQQLDERIKKLHKVLVKEEAGTLDFTPNCPIWMLRDQYNAMLSYVHILEVRAEIEGVELY